MACGTETSRIVKKLGMKEIDRRITLLWGDGSDPTTCPRNAERGGTSKEVKSGGEAGTSSTAHVHGRRCGYVNSRGMVCTEPPHDGPHWFPLNQAPESEALKNDEPPQTEDERCPECDGDGEEAFYNADIDETCYSDCWSCLGTGKRKSNPQQPETEAERSVDGGAVAQGGT